MLSRRALWLVFLAVFVLFWKPAFFLTDDIIQVGGLYGMRHGTLGIPGTLPDVYHKVHEGYLWHGYIPQVAGNWTATPLASGFLDAAALPILVLLEIPADLVGATWAFAIVASLAMAAGAWSLMGMRGQHIGRKTRGWATAAVAAIVLAGPLAMPHHVDAAPFLEVASIQWVGMLLGALAAVAFFDLLARHVPERKALVGAAILAFGTPAFYHSLGLKYHGVAISFIVLALWCYRDGWRTPPLRTGAAFFLVGIAMWSQLPMGLLLLASLGAAALPLVWRAPGTLPVRAAAGAVGMLVGLIPELLMRIQLRREGLGPQYLTKGPFLLEPGIPPSDTTLQFGDAGGGLFAHTALMTWRQLPDSFLEALAFPRGVNNGWSMPMLPAVPLMGLAFATLFVSRWRKVLGPFLVPWAGMFVAWMMFLMGDMVGVFHAGGVDMRYASIAWPAFVLLLLPPVWDVMDSVPWDGLVRRAKWAAVIATPMVLIPVLALHAYFQGRFTIWGYDREAFLPIRYAGSLLGLAFIPISLALARRWQGAVKLAAWTIPVAAALGWWFEAALVMGPGKSRFVDSFTPFVLWPIEIISHGLNIIFRTTGPY